MALNMIESTALKRGLEPFGEGAGEGIGLGGEDGGPLRRAPYVFTVCE